jgi:hypothetical protein
VIDEVADQRVSDQPGSRQTLVDDLRLHRLLHQQLAALAGPLATDVAVHEEFRRHDVQPLAHVLADAYHRFGALGCWAIRVLGLVMVIDAAKMLWRTLATRPALV